MKVAGYEFTDGARFQAGAIKDPNSVGKHLDFLREHAKGELTPEDVLKDAKNPNSPLHSFFEWDDSAAAAQHRLSQARRLIRCVVAIYISPDKPARRINAFVHIPQGEASHYRATHHAMSQKDTRSAVLKQAWREFQAWRARYQNLKEFADLFVKADEIAKKLPSDVRKQA